MLFQPIVINQISLQRHLKRWMICANEISIIYGVGKRACARARRYDSYFFLRRRCATTDSMAWHGGVWRGKRKNLIYDLFSSYFMLSVSSGRARARILPCGVSHTNMKRRRAFFPTQSSFVCLREETLERAFVLFGARDLVVYESSGSSHAGAYLRILVQERSSGSVGWVWWIFIGSKKTHEWNILRIFRTMIFPWMFFWRDRIFMIQFSLNENL